MSSRQKKLRILYVAPFWPHTDGAGGVGFRRGGSQLRSLSVLRALQEMGTVEVVVLDDEGANGDMIWEQGCELKVAYSLNVTLKPEQGVLRKLRRTFDPRSSYPNGCGVGDGAPERLSRSISDFDLVWFFKLRSPDMFPNATWPKSVLDIDDVPSTCELAMLQQGGTSPKERLLTRRRLFSWRRRERLLGDRFNILSVCSEEDREYLKGLGVRAPVHVIPNGFDKPAGEPVRCPSQPARIGFIGLFEHFPNRDGIHWFVNQCWPLIKREVPDARVRMMGLGSDGPLKPSGPDVDGLGWVANPSEEIKTWSLMVVPIRIGGGTRVKIAQGVSEKCPIVSTSLGAHGYQMRDGQEMDIADSPEAFAKACVHAIRAPQGAALKAERAWRRFLEEWTWDAIRPRVWAAAEECLKVSNQG